MDQPNGWKPPNVIPSTHLFTTRRVKDYNIDPQTLSQDKIKELGIKDAENNGTQWSTGINSIADFSTGTGGNSASQPVSRGPAEQGITIKIKTK